VGGPAAGNAGDFRNGRFEPAPFVEGFLKYCQAKALPLDFFSWHRYTDDPQELATRVHGVRDMLDRLGYTNTESHLDEWNYLPHQDWNTFINGTPEARERWYAEMAGCAGAAFVACSLIALQDAPLTMSCFYASGTGGFGLFSQQGVPNKSFFALKAFRQLLDSPHRVATVGAIPGKLGMCAGLSKERDHLTVLVSNLRAEDSNLTISLKNLPWPGATKCVVTRINADEDWETATLPELDSGLTVVHQELKPPSVCLLRLSPSSQD